MFQVLSKIILNMCKKLQVHMLELMRNVGFRIKCYILNIKRKFDFFIFLLIGALCLILNCFLVEKTHLRGFQSGPGLCSHRRWLEA